MEKLACSTSSSIHSPRINCTGCNRDYEIYVVVHVCNQLVSCDAPKRSYREEYLPTVIDMPRKPSACCEECVKKTKSSPPRKGKCPGCQFVGYCVWGPGGMCPSCIVVPVTKTASITISAGSDASNEPSTYTLPHARTNAKVFFTLSYSGTCPADGACTALVVNFATDQSLLTPEFFVRTLKLGNDEPIGEYIRNLQKNLYQMRLNYNLAWQGSSDITWEWLKYLYNTHADPAGAMLV